MRRRVCDKNYDLINSSPNPIKHPDELVEKCWEITKKFQASPQDHVSTDLLEPKSEALVLEMRN